MSISSLSERISKLVEHESSCHCPNLDCECPSAVDIKDIIKHLQTLTLEGEVAQNTIKMLAHALSLAIDDIANHVGTRPDAETYVWRAAEELKMIGSTQ